MQPIDIIAQIFGIIGMIIIILSFQAKQNKFFFLMQGVGSFMFFINFLLIGAYAGALFNLTNLIRGLLFSKNAKQPWKLALTELLYTGCLGFSLIFIWGDAWQIFLSVLPCAALLIMSVIMWKGNGRVIRYAQVSFMSPAWIVHNIFNFTLGGLVCESFNMVSSVIALIRYRKDGFKEDN